MKYELIITSFEPLTTEEKEAMRMGRGNGLGMINSYPNINEREGMRTVRSLIVMLDDKEFDAVKKAVIQVIK